MRNLQPAGARVTKRKAREHAISDALTDYTSAILEAVEGAIHYGGIVQDSDRSYLARARDKLLRELLR
jgi:hypothetical protein